MGVRGTTFTPGFRSQLAQLALCIEPPLGQADMVVLAPLERCPPAIIVREPGDTTGRFFVALSAISNDLKALYRLAHWTKQLAGPVPGPAEKGELDGTIVYVQRYGGAVLHELMEAIRDGKRSGVLDGAEFRALKTYVKNREAWESWKALLRVALDSAGQAPSKQDEPPTDLGKVLKDIRNKSAFHYTDADAFEKGYRQHFSAPIKPGVNDMACWSAGMTPGTTRFHFADGATQAHLKSVGTRKRRVLVDDVPAAIEALFEEANRALRFLVEGFLRKRQEDAKNPAT